MTQVVRGATAEGASKATGQGTHAEGVGCIAAGDNSHAEGSGSTTGAGWSGQHAEGTGSAANAGSAHAEGQTTTASATAAHSEGSSTSATAIGAHSQGLYSVASVVGQHASGILAGSWFAVAGEAQSSSVVLSGNATTNATPLELTAWPATKNLTGTLKSVVTLPASGRTIKFRIDVVARRSDVVGTAAGWELSGVITRDGSGTRLVGTVVMSSWKDAGAATWDVAVTADATNHNLAVKVTGEASKTIRWVARVDHVEVS